MSVYQADDGQFIYFDGIAKHYFATESEAWQMSREQDYITAARTHSRAIWDGIHGLLALQTEWNALSYGTELDAGEGENAGISGAEVGAVVFDTANELKLRIFDTGHSANMAKLL